jgi:outer membrane protein assembly factor BamC
VASGEQEADQGFFKNLFSGSAKSATAAKFQIAIRSQGDKTTVSVLNDLGAPELSDTAQKIIKVLAEDLK